MQLSVNGANVDVDDRHESTPLPWVLRDVHIDGRDLIDGGVVNNTPISHAVALGADIEWGLSTGYSCDMPHAPRGALAMPS